MIEEEEEKQTNKQKPAFLFLLFLPSKMKVSGRLPMELQMIFFYQNDSEAAFKSLYAFLSNEEWERGLSLSSLLREKLVRVHDSVGVKDRLDLLHDRDGLGGLGVVEVRRLHHSEAMFSADAPTVTRGPLVDVRLDLFQQLLVVLGCRHIQMQVT